MSGAALASAPQTRAAPAPISTHPLIGIAAVLFGAFISTVTSRLSVFGLADIRGAVHAGFDEGAWITTAQGCAQMLIGPPAVWLAAVFGPRRVLVVSSLSFALFTTLLPLVPDLHWLLTFQVLAGLASGTFVPLTISLVLRNLPPHVWAFGIAAYALNLELSLNISASLEGWYVEHLSWRWIFWQSVPMALGMAWCVHRGIPRLPIQWDLLHGADWFGMASFAVGMAMLYAALDQGNRLDWLNSGLVVGLLAGGALLLVAFLVQERVTTRPWINVAFATRYPIPLVMTLTTILRIAILSSALLLPQYIANVRGYRLLEAGPALLAIALPQVVIAPLVGLALRRVDARMGIAAGLLLVGGSSFYVSQNLTQDWVADTFLPFAAAQAFGQTLAMSSVIFFNVLHIRPSEALTFGVLLQSARLFGGEIGTAGMSTFVRMREQIASNLFGLNVQAGELLTQERLQAYAASVSTLSPGNAPARATAMLASTVRTQAYVQAYADGFLMIAAIMAAGLILVALLRPAPHGPASPRPLFRRPPPPPA